MRFATWNIYWFGDRSRMERSAADEDRIAAVIGKLSSDVLALQEIVDLEALAGVLSKVPGRHYVIRTGDGAWLTSAGKPTEDKTSQKVVLCIDSNTVDFVRGGAVSMKAARKPFAADLRLRGTGELFSVVAVHLRSGYPDFLDKQDALKRRAESAALAKWLRGEATAKKTAMKRPGSGKVVLLGDFNAQLDDPNDTLTPLREGELAHWGWQEPSADGGQCNTAIDDGYVIDFIVPSPPLATRVEEGPKVYAFDHDPSLGGAASFHTGPDGSGPLCNYKVSDHRPVVCSLRDE